MSATCTNNNYTLTVSFDIGTDIHTALMMVQFGRSCPAATSEIVQKQGINVRWSRPTSFGGEPARPTHHDSPSLATTPRSISSINSRGCPESAWCPFSASESTACAWLDPQKLAAQT